MFVTHNAVDTFTELLINTVVLAYLEAAGVFF